MGWCWYLKIALGTCKQEAPSQEGGRSLAESIRAPQYLTPHFLTNVTELLRAPSFSFRGCLWSSFFFFSNFAFQTSHFLCLCIKRNRWWKPQGRKANKIQPPSTWPSNSHRFSNGTERGPGRASGQTRVEHSVRSPVPPGRTRSWTPSPSGPSPPHPTAWVTFMPIACSLLRAKCWLFCTLQSIQFCGLKGQFLSAWQSPQKPFSPRIAEPQPTRNTKVWLRGTHIWGEISWVFARQARLPVARMPLLHTKGVLKTNFLNEIRSGFSFPFSLRLFSFPAFLSFWVRIYSYKGLALGITKVTS